VGLGGWRRARVGSRRKRRPTVLVVQAHPALQELLEQTLRDAAGVVLVTGQREEALEVARRVEIDVLVIDARDDRLLRELRTLQAGLDVLLLGPGRVSLSDVQQAVRGRGSRYDRAVRS
jgi:DNA-binding response OmpR family regulator